MNEDVKITEPQLSPLAQKFVQVVSRKPEEDNGKKLSVDPVVSEVASFYEKIRNAMEYQEEEVVFRVAIERILKRRLLLGSNGTKIAEPLVRELAWAKYFPDKTIPETLIEEIAKKIDLYIRLYEEAPRRFDLNKNALHDWVIDVMSSDIALTINPSKNVQLVSNLAYMIFQGKIEVPGETEENINELIFINTKRALAKEDRPFLRYHLFIQYFGQLSQESFENILSNFELGYLKIEDAFKHPLNEEIYAYTRRYSTPFIILKKLLDQYKDQAGVLLQNQEQLTLAVSAICEEAYSNIHKRVQTAIIRSIIFLLATKAVFGLLIEASVERQLYGRVSWIFLAVTILTPPLLMFLSRFFITIPNERNTKIILEQLKSVLLDPQTGSFEKNTFSLAKKRVSILNIIFISLWFMVFGAVVWGIVYILDIFQVHPVSEAVFIFFLIIVSFLMFRINQSSKVYNAYENNHNFFSILFYFAFMPFVLLGKRLTVSFSKVNIFLIVFDFIIETPFKTLFGFFEKWFTFMRSQREKLA